MLGFKYTKNSQMNPSTWGPKNVGSPKRNLGKQLGKPTLEGPKGADVLGKARGTRLKLRDFGEMTWGNLGDFSPLLVW